ncbi:50S ribosomal protein L17 [bacterium]|nr:50S ribosomal protein L17 [bacterium]|tara:strand:- start:2345 stop:2692 length:348 start_codon:yes stop_codon:yes gene_type:complete
MKHKNGNKKLNLPTDQRLSLIKGLVKHLVEKRKIKTTSTRAKETSKMVERLITIAKTDTVFNRRHIFKVINNKRFVKIIFDLAKTYQSRNGGYTKIIKCGLRKGDAAEMSLLELI